MPKIDNAPEIKKRTLGEEEDIVELVASSDYVDSVLHTADYKQDLLWHGWALREAFLAGITYQKEHGKS